MVAFAKSESCQKTKMEYFFLLLAVPSQHFLTIFSLRHDIFHLRQVTAVYRFLSNKESYLKLKKFIVLAK